MRKLAKLIRNVVAFVETVSYGKLLPYWQSERDKINLLNRKVILKQRLHLHIFLKKGLFSWKTKLRQPQKVGN